MPRWGSHLILNERDERGNHDGDALGHDGGQLVAQALATACGHEHEAVALAEHRVDGRLLGPPEPTVAEVLRVLLPESLQTQEELTLSFRIVRDIVR